MNGERPAASEGRIDNPAAFEAAFVRYFPPVFRFIAAQVGSAVAEDLAAETFATAFRRRASFEPGRGSLRSWLYGIAVNLVRSHWRAEQHQLALDARLVPEVDLSDDSDAADRRLAASLLAPRLAAALGQLTVADNVLLRAQLAGTPRRKARATCEQLLARLGIGRYQNSYPGRLSGGERQRVAIARALVNSPAVELGAPVCFECWTSGSGSAIVRLLLSDFGSVSWSPPPVRRGQARACRVQSVGQASP